MPKEKGPSNSKNKGKGFEKALLEAGGGFELGETKAKDQKVSVTKDKENLEIQKKEVGHVAVKESTKDIVKQIRDLKAKNPDLHLEKGYRNKESAMYWKKIHEIVQLVKHGGGITKVVIHGNPIFDNSANFEKLHGEKGWGKGYKSTEEQKFLEPGPAIEINNDFDTKGALLLLSELAETNPEFFAEGAVTEVIPKGTNETFIKTNFYKDGKKVERKAELILYLDVGNKNISIETTNEKGQSNAHIYADHHGEEGGYETSATQIIYDIGKAGGMFKEGKKISKEKLQFYSQMARFINKVDNLNFIDDLSESEEKKGKKRLVDINYLKNDFAYSLYSLAKFLPFETVLEILGKLDKEGKLATEKFLTKNKKLRNWPYTFHPNEMNLDKFGGMKIKHVGREITLRNLIKENQKEIDETIDSEKQIFEYMKNAGINTTSPLVGKFIYRNYFKIEKKDHKGKTYKESPYVKDNIAYLVARGLGADSFVSYSGKDGKIFINSNGQFDLMAIWKELNKIVPGYPKPVRNKFLFHPKDPTMLALIKEKITEEVFLKILSGEKIQKEKKTKNTKVESRPESEIKPEPENKTAHINTDKGIEDEDSMQKEETSGIIGSGRGQMSEEEFADFASKSEPEETEGQEIRETAQEENTWSVEDEETLNNLLEVIEKTKNKIAEIDKEIELITESEKQAENLINKEGNNITQEVVTEIKKIETEIEQENEQIIETELEKQIPKIEDKSTQKNIQEKIKKLPSTLRSKLLKYIVIPLGLATGIAANLNEPKEYYEMVKNWKERHIDKKDINDPSIIGIDAIYNDTTDIERTTYDFIGKEKINYKFGYYMTSVFDLTDRTPPRFKYINERDNFSKMDSSAGITTTLFNEFKSPLNFKPQLKEHLDDTPEQLQETPVIAYNPKTQMIRAGHLKEFNEDWLVSETYEIPLDFRLNEDKTVNLIYPHSTMRMVALTTNENGKQIPFPIGITKDKSIKTFNPYEATRFGVLEGGKVIMVCGDKQLQVNGSFADMFRVYERLKKENSGKKISAYLLDNGSYNLPIWDKDSTLTPNEIREHVLRHRGGGTALVLINDNRISPFEYKNKYKEYEHYTPNFTKDSITGKPAMNEKSVIVMHHTGHYHNSNAIIKQFEEDTTMGNAHVLILKDGTRHLFNTDDYVLAHAGKSVFNGREKVNYFSLGIEMEGDSRDKNAFTVAQIESMLEYARPRIEKYNIKFENIIDHKRIRDNWLKAHPSRLDEKGNKVHEKEDLDDKVWEQFQKIIQEKIYKKIQNKDLGMNEKKLIGMLSFQEFYRVSNNVEFSLDQSRKVLKKNGFTVKEIKSIFRNIKSEGLA